MVQTWCTHAVKPTEQVLAATIPVLHHPRCLHALPLVPSSFACSSSISSSDSSSHPQPDHCSELHTPPPLLPGRYMPLDSGLRTLCSCWRGTRKLASAPLSRERGLRPRAGAAGGVKPTPPVPS